MIIKTINELHSTDIDFMYRVMDAAQRRLAGESEYIPARPDLDLMWLVTNDLKRKAPRTVIKAGLAAWCYLAAIPPDKRDVNRVMEMSDGSLRVRRYGREVTI